MHYLMTSDARGGEDVVRYTDGEMIEIFSADDRAALARGETVKLWGMRWIDMRVAARTAIREAA